MKIAVIVILVTMFIQDIKSRSILWFLFPILSVLLVVIRASGSNSVKAVLLSAITPICCLVIIMGFTSLYFSARKKAWVNITGALIGWADILFLVSVAFYLPSLNFMLFFISSSIIILFIWLGLSLLSLIKTKFIPFAGLQALLFAGLLLVSWECPEVRLNDDNWLFYLLQR
ncbi:hypothetical protein IDJ77_08370 [Mucilaginibacter sp. ZT4R22]|uniref:Leader peptidase (Prepilin peptidase)/N-methyltransferase n=1 Tax=Mucilaginibacter pankratovii TaxID=2772110 RepID=A0ABR7WND1_9SPHI|nr:hypothetical protein [Mucilaginibacter pankratovii]MBD1363824.1 hypothetical protein [Mucilaginibacter pankratovii]